MLKIAIILGSTRPHRNGEAVARWAYGLTRQRGDGDCDLIDLREMNLPLLDEAIPPSEGEFQHEHTKAFVGHGSAGGTRAVEHLRGICAELQVATVRQQVMLSLHTDFENFSSFRPAAHHARSFGTLLDQWLAWAGALRTVRQGQAA